MEEPQAIGAITRSKQESSYHYDPTYVLDYDEEKQNSIMKIVLVKGCPIDLEQELETNVYFDQSGELTTKFNITQVPAIVEQNGKYLKVMEVYIGKAR